MLSQHKPGVLVGNDAAPSFSAQTLPPGTAPADRTFEPDTKTEVPSQASYPADADEDAPLTSASDTLVGATSADVYTGLGKPLQGETSTEEHRRKNPGGYGAGLVGTGASGAPSGNQTADERVQPSQRGIEREEATTAGTRGREKIEIGADELPNERADNP